MSSPWIKGWMGKYPRKGADWSPEEDAALMRAYESGRYLNKEIAARHLREPVAIERRLDSLRRRRDIVARYEQVRSWASEREAAQRAVSGIKATFASTMWPRQHGKARLAGELRALKVGEIARGYIVTKQQWHDDGGFCTAIRLSDLPPEVAQAIQFGGKS